MDIAELKQKLSRAGLQERESQMDMIQSVYDALKHNKILCIEAPTGTGKTISYCIASYYAKQSSQPIIISTATIALQEQLVNKDLPLLAEVLGEEMKFGLAKGRRRYICLERLFNPDQDQDLFSKNEAIEKIRQQVDKKRWSGDRDQLSFTVPDEEWQSISTDAAGCSGKLCDFYEDCLYYKARKKMHSSDFIVANHSLLLSDLELGGGAVLPDPNDVIYIIDECHHLPDKALDHCSKSASVLGAIEWINNINRTVNKGLQTQNVSESTATQITNTTHELVNALKQAHEFLNTNPDFFKDGIWQISEINKTRGIPEAFLPLAEAVKTQSQTLTMLCYQLLNTLDEKLQQNTQNEETKQSLSKLHTNFKFLTDRAGNLSSTWYLFCHQREKSEAPIARWFEKHTNPFHEAEWSETFLCHCAPINISHYLQKMLWDRTKNGIVLCSATVRALGKFDDYRRKSGLKDNTRLQEKHLDSFFDYSKSVLYVPAMQHEPSGLNQDAHRREAIELLPKLILPHSGTLVLFTSQVAMETTFAQLPMTLTQDILMQGEKSKNKLIESHKERIRRGRRSILFGLASFGEGLDLPADFCEHVIIHKLPFAVPSTPIESTRTEWLEHNKLNPFMLSTLPATSIRLTQYVGRLLRQESDVGIVTILDKRLYSKFYGKDLLMNLPKFTRLINAPPQTLYKHTLVEHLFSSDLSVTEK